MIVPMKKYTLLAYHKEYIEFLQGLQELGVVHVIEKESGEIENEELREKYQQLNELSATIKFLEKFEAEPEKPGEGKSGSEILHEINKLRSDEEDASHALALLQKEINQLEPWGNFSWNTIRKLSEAGYSVDFFMCPARNFSEDWQKQFDLEIINDEGGMVFFVVIRKSNEEIALDAEKVRLPDRSLSDLENSLEGTRQKLESTQDLYSTYAARYTGLLQETYAKIRAELDFSQVVLNTEKQADDRLMVLEGWVPEDQIEAVNTYLDNSGVYYESEGAHPDQEAPPIKLKNNKFARLYESIGELYTFPDYKELDLTPFFAPFYMLFFGFCLGDAGYGLLIVLGTIIGLYKAPKKIKPLMKLGLFLGISTTIMGIIGGTVFGIMLHPDDFKSSYELAPWIKKYQQYILSSNNLMYTALGLGYVQVVFGMFINAANRARVYGFKYAVSQLGWNIIVLVTLPTFALFYFEVGPAAPLRTAAIVSGIIGGIPAFFYNTPGKNPLLNFGVGLWETYQVASGLLGDILSYIRLFALGLSSAILGNVFNQLAMQSSQGVGGGIIGALIMIVILAFGHGLNFFMAALGSFVHPLRLTFVEFYKNAGFMGGGKKYQPFAK